LSEAKPNEDVGFCAPRTLRERTSTQPTNQGIFPQRRRYC